MDRQQTVPFVLLYILFLAAVVVVGWAITGLDPAELAVRVWFQITTAFATLWAGIVGAASFLVSLV
jgi:hypothetical protein